MNISELRAEAANGSVVAQSILGICLLHGIEVEPDYEEAFRLLSAASAKGAPRACRNLAKMYAEGLGVQVDAAEAVRLYQYAAQHGEFDANIELARIYAAGSLVEPRPGEAFRLYRVFCDEVAALGTAVGSECDEELAEAREYLATVVPVEGDRPVE